MTYVILTERLGLRQLTEGDLPELNRMLGDPEVMTYYPEPWSRAKVDAWLERNQLSYTHHGHGIWAIERRTDGTFLGECGLLWQEVEGVRDVEVGWHVQKENWRQGIASEAGAACLAHALDVVGLPRVISIIRPANIPSRGVAEKIGMTVGWEASFHDIHHLIYCSSRSERSP